jgi:tripartite-type tricarboxylate transporter receptor subunit TctC
MNALRYSILAASLLLVAPQSFAQTYPMKPIRVVVPFAPGGGTDAHTRIVGQKLNERWGQPVLVDNRSGANGNIGAALVAKAPTDGYTLLVTSGSFATNPGVYESLPFDPIRSFEPVVMLSPTYYAVIVPSALPVHTLKELIALGRKNNNRLTAAISGVGSPAHLAGELFRTMTKMSFLSVPYRGTGPALSDVVAGQADLMFCDSLAAAPHVRAGKLKALAVSSLKRVPTLPEVPPASEVGVPGFEAISWSGMFAPAGTPHAIVKQLNVEINTILRLPDVQQRLYSDGTAFGENTPEWMAAFVKREIEKWTKVAKASGTRAE